MEIPSSYECKCALGLRVSSRASFRNGSPPWGPASQPESKYFDLVTSLPASPLKYANIQNIKHNMYNQSGKQFVPSFKLSDLQLAKEVTSDTSGKDGRAGGRLTCTNCPFCPPPQKTTTNASYTIWERPPGPIFSHTLLPTHMYQALPIRVAMPSGHRGRTAQCHRSVPCTRFPERPPVTLRTSIL